MWQRSPHWLIQPVRTCPQKCDLNYHGFNCSQPAWYSPKQLHLMKNHEKYMKIPGTHATRRYKAWREKTAEKERNPPGEAHHWNSTLHRASPVESLGPVLVVSWCSKSRTRVFCSGWRNEYPPVSANMASWEIQLEVHSKLMFCWQNQVKMEDFPLPRLITGCIWISD